MPSIEISSTSSSSSTTVRRASAPVGDFDSVSFSMPRKQYPTQSVGLASSTPCRADDLFPELDAERARLAVLARCRDGMIERFRSVDPDASADDDHQGVHRGHGRRGARGPAHARRRRLLRPDHRATPTRRDRALVHRPPPHRGRRRTTPSSSTGVHRSPRPSTAPPVADPFGLVHRRRFTLADGDITAYLDEQLDDPDAADVATGVPDPVLAEIGAARTGAMREIVATIQAEQDVVIRAPIDQCLVVQGGPGTGKTAVGLHRAAYLLFEHRRRLVRDGVLVVGPNKVFLDYIGNVLPSLGERSVQQRTALDLCVPRVEITGRRQRPRPGARRGRRRCSPRWRRASTRHVELPTETVREPFGARTLVFEADEIGGLDRCRRSTASLPVNRRRDSLKPIVAARAAAAHRLRRRVEQDRRCCARRSTRRGRPCSPSSSSTASCSSTASARAASGGAWTAADQFLVDEANTLLNGPPFTFGHVVVDEAQDHSAVALRAIGRRSPTGSMTVLGDLAQSTTPAGQQRLGRGAGAPHPSGTQVGGVVAHLTIGYRVPGPILDVANRLLPLTDVEHRRQHERAHRGRCRRRSAGRPPIAGRRRSPPRCAPSGTATTTPASSRPSGCAAAIADGARRGRPARRRLACRSSTATRCRSSAPRR